MVGWVVVWRLAANCSCGRGLRSFLPSPLWYDVVVGYVGAVCGGIR